MTEPLIISESAKEAYAQISERFWIENSNSDDDLASIQTAIDIEKEKAVAELKEESRRQKSEYEALYERHKIDRMVEDRQQKAGEKLSAERDELKRQNAELVKAFETKDDAIRFAIANVDNPQSRGQLLTEKLLPALASTQERKI